MQNKATITPKENEKIIGTGDNLYLVLLFYHDEKDMYICRANSEDEARNNFEIYSDEVKFIITWIDPTAMPVMFYEQAEMP